MDAMNVVESLIRWMHVVAGITWIGLLYFFNWVNIPFQAAIEGVADIAEVAVPQ